VDAFYPHVLHQAPLQFRRNPRPRQRPFRQDALGEPPARHFLLNVDIAELIHDLGLLYLSRPGTLGYVNCSLPCFVGFPVCLDSSKNRSAQSNGANRKNQPGNGIVVQAPQRGGGRQV
jgi:hypothetical protein